MKKIIIITMAIEFFAQQLIYAQGTIYLSNLGLTSTGSEPVGSDSWLAVPFETGVNADGYDLNSIQLAMGNATGSPSGFTVMLYANGDFPEGGSLGNSVGTLEGSVNPSTAGIYVYTPAADITLSPNAIYSIVLAAGTTVANGAYEWSLAGTYSYNPNGGWRVGSDEGQIAVYLQSSQGSSWIGNQGNIQFAITATAIPEPSTSFLLLLGSGLFIYVHRTFHR